MRAFLLMGTALALSSSLALAQSTGSTGSGSSTGTTSSPSTSSTTNSSSSTSPSQTTPLGSQTTSPTGGTTNGGRTTPATTNSNSNSDARTGATGTDRSNTVLPPNSPSSVTPAYTAPGSPGSYNPNNVGISGGSTAALDLKHGTRVSKLKDAESKLIGAKLVDSKGQAIGEVASVKTQRSGRVTQIVVSLDNGRKVKVAAGPLTYLAANNVVVTRQSARSFERGHRAR